MDKDFVQLRKKMLNVPYQKKKIADTTVSIKTNVNPKDAALVNEHLVQCLRDSVMVFNQTQLVHWGLMGSKFYQVHLP